MAAFSFQHHPFLLDSIFFSNTPSKMSVFLEEPNTTTTCFSQFHQTDPSQEIPVCVNKSSCLEHSNSRVGISNNETSVTNKLSMDSSSVLEEKLESGEQVSQKVIPKEKKRKNRDGSSLNSAQSKDIREVKGKKQKKRNGVMKDVEEEKPTTDKKDEKKNPEEPPTGYIHVRARRGQATDSHSLAERVRREKISERMKLLQALVPGCDKVTGKAVMLDEIINYVQSLQNQVEFLSMKLASAHPMFYDFGMDLDTFMFKPDQQCSPTQPTAISDTTYTANNYLLPDSSIVFQQGQQMPNNLSQNTGQPLWDVDDQRQKNTYQFGFRNNLCSFH